jgi:hypothetical protein
VSVNSSGHIELAESDGLFRAVGASSAAFSTAEVASIYSVQGRLTTVRFDSVPLLADNGKPVYLSATPGIVSLTQPTVGRVIEVGVLATADGVTITPSIIWSPLAPGNFPQIDEFFPSTILMTSSYVLTETPILATLTVYYNGKRLARGVGCDYTLVGKTVMLARKVKPGYIVAAEYEYI